LFRGPLPATPFKPCVRLFPHASQSIQAPTIRALVSSLAQPPLLPLVGQYNTPQPCAIVSFYAARVYPHPDLPSHRHRLSRSDADRRPPGPPAVPIPAETRGLRVRHPGGLQRSRTLRRALLYRGDAVRDLRRGNDFSFPLGHPVSSARPFRP